MNLTFLHMNLTLLHMKPVNSIISKCIGRSSINTDCVTGDYVVEVTVSQLFYMVPGNCLQILYHRATNSMPMIVNIDGVVNFVDNTLRHEFIINYINLNKPYDFRGLYTFTIGSYRKLTLTRDKLLALIKCKIFGCSIRRGKISMVYRPDGSVSVGRTRVFSTEVDLILHGVDPSLIRVALEGDDYADLPEISLDMINMYTEVDLDDTTNTTNTTNTPI